MTKIDTDRERVNRALRNLRSSGFFTRIAWRRAYDDAWDEARSHENVVFYRKEGDVESFDENGRFKKVLYLQWSGDVRKIIKALHSQGLVVDWDGSEKDCIFVLSDNMLIKTPGMEGQELSDIKEDVEVHVRLMLKALDIHRKLAETIGDSPDISTLIAVSRLYHSARLFFEEFGGEEAMVADFMDKIGQDIVKRDLEIDACSCPKHLGQGHEDKLRYIG